MKDLRFSRCQKDMQNRLSHRRRSIIPFLLSIAFTIRLNFTDFMVSQYEYEQLPIVLNIITQIFILFFFYAQIQIVIMIVYYVNKATKKIINNVVPEYEPFHPDGWAGFASISRITIRGFYFLAIAFIGIIALVADSKAYPNILSFYIYVCTLYVTYLGVVVGTLLPLLYVRNYLHLWKKAIVQQIRGRVGPLNLNVSTASTASLKNSMFKLRTIAALPEWPRQLQGFPRILLTIVTVLLPLAISLLVDYLRNSANLW